MIKYHAHQIDDNLSGTFSINYLCAEFVYLVFTKHFQESIFKQCSVKI